MILGILLVCNLVGILVFARIVRNKANEQSRKAERIRRMARSLVEQTWASMPDVIWTDQIYADAKR